MPQPQKEPRPNCSSLPRVTHHKKQEAATTELHSQFSSLSSGQFTILPSPPTSFSHGPKNSPDFRRHSLSLFIAHSAAGQLIVCAPTTTSTTTGSPPHSHAPICKEPPPSTFTLSQLCLSPTSDSEVFEFRQSRGSRRDLKADNCFAPCGAPDGGELALKSPGSSAHSLPHQLIADSANQVPVAGLVTNGKAGQVSLRSC